MDRKVARLAALRRYSMLDLQYHDIRARTRVSTIMLERQGRGGSDRVRRRDHCGEST